MAKFSINDVVLRSRDALGQAIDDDMVVMQTETGEYYALRNTSLRIWQLIESSTSIEQIISEMSQGVDVSRDVIERDVMEFIDQLLEAKLIVVVPETQTS